MLSDVFYFGNEILKHTVCIGLIKIDTVTGM